MILFAKLLMPSRIPGTVRISGGWGTRHPCVLKLLRGPGCAASVENQNPRCKLVQDRTAKVASCCLHAVLEGSRKNSKMYVAPSTRPSTQWNQTKS